MNLDRDPLAIKLARAFADQVQNHFDPEILAEVVRRNDTAGYDMACATHDFCDANMLMLLAMNECGIVFNVEDDSQAQLTDAAWSLARAASFLPEDILGARQEELPSGQRP